MWFRKPRNPVKARSMVPMPPTRIHKDKSKYTRKTKHKARKV